jgi:predicted DNA-binding ribbon-helix-helix protein
MLYCDTVLQADAIPQQAHLVLRGQKTSVTIEPEFWDQLRLIAMEYQTSVPKLNGN